MPEPTSMQDLYERLKDLGFSKRFLQQWALAYSDGYVADVVEPWRVLKHMCDRLASEVADVAAWFETPLVRGYWVSPEALLMATKNPEVISALVDEVADNRTHTMALVLDTIAPDWQKRYKLGGDWEPFHDVDGRESLRLI